MAWMLTKVRPLLDAALLACSCLSSGCLRGPPPRDASPSPRPSEKSAYYRMDYVVSARDPSAAGTSSAYTMVLEENRGGEVMVGSNVPLSATSQSRMDLGLKIHGQFSRVGENDVVVQTHVEMSSSEEASGIHKLTATTDAWVAPGQPTLVASIDDPTSHKRYQVSVTATRMR
jgi:hypothetical protein